MNLESLRYRDLTDYLSFYDYVSKRISDNGKTYLIFDELQAVTHWEKAIESFRLDFDVDIYITGYAFEPTITMEEKFQKYLQFDGMPILREYQLHETRMQQALEGIYSTVVLRDILQRSNQADQNTLQKIMLFLCSNIGSITLLIWDSAICFLAIAMRIMNISLKISCFWN